MLPDLEEILDSHETDESKSKGPRSTRPVFQGVVIRSTRSRLARLIAAVGVTSLARSRQKRSDHAPIITPSVA